MTLSDYRHLLRKWQAWRLGLPQPIWRKNDAWRRGGRAVASTRGRFLYVPIAKVASTSIKHAIAEFDRGHRLPEDFHIHTRRANFFVPLDAVEYFDGYRFSVVRHPLTRMISCHREKTQLRLSPSLAPFGLFFKGMSFHDFLEAVAGIPDADADGHFVSQASRLKSCNAKGKLRVDFVGKMESMDEDWLNIAANTGLPALRHRNPTVAGASYPEPDPALEKIVRKRFARDYDLFDYAPLW